MQEEYQAFQDAGAEVVALAVSPLSAIEQGVQNVISPSYPLLADPEHEVAEAFNVYNLLGNGYAAPSVFVIDEDGRVVWSYIGQSRTDRPSASTVLRNIP